MDRLWTLSPGPPLLSSFLQSGQRPTSRHDRSSILALQGRAQGFALGWELFGPQGADAQGVALGLPRELPWACLKAFLTSWVTRSVWGGCHENRRARQVGYAPFLVESRCDSKVQAHHREHREHRGVRRSSLCSLCSLW